MVKVSSALLHKAKAQVYKAAKLLREVYRRDSNWRELTSHLPEVGLLTVSKQHLNKLINLK